MTTGNHFQNGSTTATGQIYNGRISIFVVIYVDMCAKFGAFVKSSHYICYGTTPLYNIIFNVFFSENKTQKFENILSWYIYVHFTYVKQPYITLHYCRFKQPTPTPLHQWSRFSWPLPLLWKIMIISYLTTQSSSFSPQITICAVCICTYEQGHSHVY